LSRLLPVTVNFANVVQGNTVLAEETTVNDEVTLVAFGREDGRLRTFALEI
jgi:hypothetical protein